MNRNSMGDILVMEKKLVTVESVNNKESEYIIRDKASITIGRAFIIELSKDKKFCMLRLKFYKTGKESHIYLKEALKLFLTSLLVKMNIYKINFITSDEINTKTFKELGFQLEGILNNSSFSNNVFSDEYIFGIDSDIYKQENINRDMKLEGKDIYLKVLKPINAEQLLNFYSKNKKYLKPFETNRDLSFYTLQVQKSNLAENYRQFLNGTNVNFGIFKDTVLIGKIQISNIVIGVFKSAFVGYSIDEEEQNKGYMKQSLLLLIKYAFETMGLHRLEASTLTDNFRSQSVLKACGFKEIGINKNYLFINNVWRDHITFFKINEENN
jgi:[ribosomal protein S5]-alanine N-acetyltransferase